MPVAPEDFDARLHESYQRAYRALNDGDGDAVGMFAELAEVYPDDPLVGLHRKRIQRGERSTTIVIRKK